MIVRETPSIVLVPPDLQEDRLDVPFYGPSILPWIDYEKNTPDLLWVDLIDYLAFSTVGFVGKVSDKYVENGIPYITNKNVKPFQYSDKNMKFVAESFADTIANTRLQDYDVLVSRSGNAGSACVFPKTETRVCCGDILILRCREELSPDFLAAYINATVGTAIISRHCSGSTLTHLNLNAIRAARIPILGKGKAGLQRQTTLTKRLRDVLHLAQEVKKRAAGLMAKRRRTATNIDSAFLSVFNCQSFPDFLGDATQRRLPNEQVGNRIVNAKIGDLEDRLDPRAYLPNRLKSMFDKDGCWETLGESYEVDYSREAVFSAVEHVAIDEMPIDPWGPFSTIEVPGNTNVAVFRENDIAISRLLPTISNGKCFKAWTALTGSPEFIRVRTKSELESNFVFYWMKSRLVQEYLTSRVRGSSGSQKRFTDGDLRDCPIPKLSEAQMRLSVERCGQVVDDCLAAAEVSRTLHTIANQLIAKVKGNIFQLLDERFVAELTQSTNDTIAEIGQ